MATGDSSTTETKHDRLFQFFFVCPLFLVNLDSLSVFFLIITIIIIIIINFLLYLFSPVRIDEINSGGS